jgi:hypothetical protein
MTTSYGNTLNDTAVPGLNPEERPACVCGRPVSCDGDSTCPGYVLMRTNGEKGMAIPYTRLELLLDDLCDSNLKLVLASKLTASEYLQAQSTNRVFRDSKGRIFAATPDV